MPKREAEKLASEIWAFKDQQDAVADTPITLEEATAVFLERRFFAIPRLVTEVGCMCDSSCPVARPLLSVGPSYLLDNLVGGQCIFAWQASSGKNLRHTTAVKGCVQQCVTMVPAPD